VTAAPGSPARGSVPRLLALTGAIVLLENLYYSVLSPLLPGLQRGLGLSTSQSGLLVAMFGLGALAGAVPAAGMAARLGVRPVAVAGLLLLAAMSAVFGAAQDYPALAAARLLQGVGGVACSIAAIAWILEMAPAGRRGELIGVTFGASAAGTMLGPAVGGAADGIGRAPAFAAVAGVALLLAAVTAQAPAPPAAGRGSLGLAALAASRRVRAGAWFTAVPALLLGAISVLVPLQLHRLGSGAGEIGAVFLVAAAAGMPVRALVGRWSDRAGRLQPIRAGLLAGFALLVALPWPQDRAAVALLAFLALVATALFWVPGFALLSDACSDAGAGQLVGVVTMNVAWPPGFILGSAGGGAIAEAAGRPAAYAVLGAVLLCTFFALRGRPEPARGPGRTILTRGGTT
jgi:MFS family permease